MKADTQATTRAQRLDALVATVGANATYAIHTLEGTRRRITIDDPETGDRIGAVGDTLDQTIDNLAAKVEKR